MNQLTTFLAIREKMRTFAESLTDEQLFRIPEAFPNSIAWNLGHVLVTHQLLCYKLSGLDMHVDNDTVAMFAKASSPRDWTTQPDLRALTAQLVPLGERFAQDHEAGLFKEFEPYTTSTGVELTNIEVAFSYNLMHEGLHLGYAMALHRAP